MFNRFLNNKAFRFTGFFTLCLLSFSLVFTACEKEDDKKDLQPEFDKKAMLSNIGSQIIVKNYSEFELISNDFYTAVLDFNSNTNETKLIELQNKFKTLYEQWQYCSTFEFGPAEQLALRSNLNTFPTDSTQINSNIHSGSYQLDAASNMDAKGFPAIDYLLFSSSNQDVLEKFNNDTQAAERKKYLLDLAGEIKKLSSSVYQMWQTAGSNYLSTFENNTGSDINGSIGLLINQFNYDFELLKNAKLGIPLGKRTLGNALPEKVEAPYSNYSNLLISAQLQNLEYIYLGTSKGKNEGIGLDDYLEKVDAKYNGASLNQKIKEKFSSLKIKINNLPKSLNIAVVEDYSQVDACYAEMQQLAVLLKVDMPSVLGVIITYQDNDGD
jgi:predicted lipoprotein